MAADVLVNSLPCEVIEHILVDKNLQISDVMSFALTCKQLYWTVTTSNKLWKTKFLQRWPFLREAFENHGPMSGNDGPQWREEAKERMLCRRRLMDKLSQMSAKHYGKQELAPCDLGDFDPLFLPECGANPMNYDYLTDELITLIRKPIIGSNLTHKYYAYKVIRYLRQTYLAKEWQKYLALPAQRQTTECGAILVAQWSQPDKRVSARKVTEMLDEIAQQTRILVAERYPAIRINEVPICELDRWKNENLYDNVWSNEDSRIIVTTLCEVMFNRLGFHGNSEMYYSSVNSFIDQVLKNKRGIPITLAIVFESVARRLGLHCETVSFPAHFLLRWKERYIPKVKSDEDVESYYIDVFNGGQFLTRNSCSGIAGATRCPIEKYNVHQATSPVKVVQRMANNLEIAGRQRTHLNGRAVRLRSALELLHMVKPRDTNTILHLARFYILHQMDVTDLLNTLNNMLTLDDEEVDSRGQVKQIIRLLEDYEQHRESEKPKPKVRTSDVKYAVGMIMKDGLLNRCVITGWDIHRDEECETEFQRQPFYHVYVEDGSCRYVAQESLVFPASPGLVNHYEIGRYFSQYMGMYYLPNEEKSNEYPEDEEIRDQHQAMGAKHNFASTNVSRKSF